MSSLRDNGLDSGEFEDGKTGAIRVLGKLGFSIEKELQPIQIALTHAPVGLAQIFEVKEMRK
jgi:hypothetical protein